MYQRSQLLAPGHQNKAVNRFNQKWAPEREPVAYRQPSPRGLGPRPKSLAYSSFTGCFRGGSRQGHGTERGRGSRRTTGHREEEPQGKASQQGHAEIKAGSELHASGVIERPLQRTAAGSRSSFLPWLLLPVASGESLVPAM